MEKEHEFLNYFKKPLPREDILNYYKISKIEEPKVTLLRNIVTSLFSLIYDTYLGDDIMNNNDRDIHFEWCWNKLTTDFKTIDIDLTEKNNFKRWIKSVCFDNFYNDNSKEKDGILLSTKKLWESILDMDDIKSRSDVDLLIDIYNYYYQ